MPPLCPRPVPALGDRQRWGRISMANESKSLVLPVLRVCGGPAATRCVLPSPRTAVPGVPQISRPREETVGPGQALGACADMAHVTSTPVSLVRSARGQADVNEWGD